MENFRTIWSIMIHTGHHLGPLDRESGARCTEIATLKKEEAAVQFHRRSLLRPTFLIMSEPVFRQGLAEMRRLLDRMPYEWDFSNNEED